MRWLCQLHPGSFVKASFIKQHFDIADQTLRKWADSKKIGSIKVGDTGRRLYDYQSFLRAIGSSAAFADDKRRICYARVSSTHQRKDLDRQISYLKERYPNHEIISDVASGLNFQRKGLQTILDAVIQKTVSEVVVTHQDRLSRFAFDLIHWLCEKFECKLVVLNQTTDSSPELEIAQDVLSVINFFTAKNNGLRSAAYRKARQEKKEELSDGEGED